MATRTLDHAHTVDAYQRRLDKATAVVTALRAAGYQSRGARLLTQDQRRVVEKFAGVRQCSDETWSVVLAIMAGVRRG